MTVFTITGTDTSTGTALSVQITADSIADASTGAVNEWTNQGYASPSVASVTALYGDTAPATDGTEPTVVAPDVVTETTTVSSVDEEADATLTQIADAQATLIETALAQSRELQLLRRGPPAHDPLTATDVVTVGNFPAPVSPTVGQTTAAYSQPVVAASDQDTMGDRMSRRSLESVALASVDADNVGLLRRSFERCTLVDRRGNLTHGSSR